MNGRAVEKNVIYITIFFTTLRGAESVCHDFKQLSTLIGYDNNINEGLANIWYYQPEAAWPKGQRVRLAIQRDCGFQSRYDHYLDLFHVNPEFRFSATLVISQLVLPPASWDSYLC